MVMGSARTLVAATAQVGEGPVWDAAAQRLLWVDIPAGLVHSTTLDGTTTTFQAPTMVGAVAPRSGGGIVAAVREGIAVISPEGHFEHRLPMLEAGQRMNDAKCDSRGRLWAGSTDIDFAEGKGMLHTVWPDWTTQVVLEGLTLPNGLGWSPDDRTFYLADSMERVVWEFDFDPDSARITNRRPLRRFSGNGPIPDGLCVDAAGCLWIAMWGGRQLIVLAADGEIIDQVEVPVHQPSSCAFAGADLDLLCITSAREGLGLSRNDPAPDGSVLCLEGTGAHGLPCSPFGG